MNIAALKRLTIGEVAKVEEVSGQSITSMADDAQPKARVLIAVTWVLKRRTNPSISLAEVEALTLSEISDLLNGDELGDDDAPKSD